MFILRIENHIPIYGNQCFFQCDVYSGRQFVSVHVWRVWSGTNIESVVSGSVCNWMDLYEVVSCSSIHVDVASTLYT